MGIKTWLGLKKPPVREVVPTSTRSAFLDFLERFRPMRAVGFEKVRLGRRHDGGYVMLDDFAGVDAAFSCGIADDCSWDRDIAAKGIPVHQYDPSIEASPEANPLFTFHRMAVGARPGPDRVTLADMARVVGGRTGILKVDIEGAEWDCFALCRESDLDCFSQIVVEFHDLRLSTDAEILHRYQEAAEKISKLFACIHLHANNSGTYPVVLGVPVPDVIEVTFASRRRYTFLESEEIFPTHLDLPNDPARPDYSLGNFRFR